MRFIVLLLTIVLFSTSLILITAPVSFSTSPSPLPGNTIMEIPSLPTLNEEFDLTVTLIPNNYSVDWVSASDEKKWSTEFTLILPKSFEVVDDDFSDGGYYGQRLLDNYKVVSAVRDVSFPPQTTIKIKPTEPGLWQIIAQSGAFTPGKIFVTLTENYSYISDKSNDVIRIDACNQDLNGWHDNIAMFDVESNSIIKNVKNDFIAEWHSKDWKLTINPVTDLLYVYEYYTTTIPIIDGNSGETKDNLKLNSQTSNHSRISDIAINSETNLIYIADNGRRDWKNYSGILVLDGKTNSIVSSIEYIDGEEEYGESTASIAINPKTNILYAMTGRDNLYIINLETENVITKLDLGKSATSGAYDVEVNSVTNKIYVLNGEENSLYVINGFTNSIDNVVNVDYWTHKIQINERDNKIYLLNSSTGKLWIIDGVDYKTSTINLHHPGHDMSFDHINDRLYVTNRDDGSLTMLDSNTLEFDIINNCSFISNISINPETETVYTIDKKPFNIGNVVELVKPNQNDQIWIENSVSYPRTEYFSDEQIDFKISNLGDSDIVIDSIKIKNTNTNNIVYTFTESQLIEQNNSIEIMWDQMDLNGKQAISGHYAVLLQGHDNNNVLYKTHKLFSIVDENDLNHLKALHKNMFSYLELNDTNSKKTTLSSELDDSVSTKTFDDFTSQKKSDMLTDTPICEKNPVLVTKNYKKFACVKYLTSEKLVLQGWEIVSTKQYNDAVNDIAETVQDQKHGVIQEFPLISKVIDNGLARFNVEFSHRPVLNEEFDITINFEIPYDEIVKKESNKTIPIMLTLDDGIDYVSGDMQKNNRKYSLVTEKYNTMYKSDNPKTTPRIYESTSTLKFSQHGEHYLAAYVDTEHFDTFWFFVDDDGIVHMKEEITYDYRELSQLMQRLARDNPESIDKELEDIFGVYSKRVLEEYYERFEYQRPIAPIDISTTKVQLRDIICPEDIFYKFTQKGWETHDGIRCGSESTLEYYSDISLDVFNRDEAMKILTVNLDPNGISEKMILVDTRETKHAYNEWNPSRQSIHNDKVVLPPPYHYLGQQCSNDALYATFEIPEQVKIGKEFDVVLTYNWRLPNSNWDAMLESDKKTMQKLRDEYVPLAEIEERENNNPVTTMTEKELDDLDDQIDTILEQMEEILEKYELPNSDFNVYGYQITNYYPECEEPTIGITFSEEIEILSDGFNMDSRSDKHKLVEYSGETTISFSNDDYPQTSTIKLIVNEPTFHLVNLLNIDVAGNMANFVFSTTDDVVTFSHNYPKYLERMSSDSTILIDKFGNRILPHEQGGTAYSFDSVLHEYAQLHNMTLEEQQELQLEFTKHKILYPDEDFAKFYKIFYDKDISDEIDYVKLGPPMEDLAEFIREHVSKNEDDIEGWLMSENDLHPDWIKEFLKQYPEFKN